MEVFVVSVCFGMMECTVAAVLPFRPEVKIPMYSASTEMRYERWVNGKCEGALQWNSYSQRFQTILPNGQRYCPPMWKGSTISEAREFGATEY